MIEFNNPVNVSFKRVQAKNVITPDKNLEKMERNNEIEDVLNSTKSYLTC